MNIKQPGEPNVTSPIFPSNGLDKLAILTLSAYFLLWAPYKLIFGTKNLFNTAYVMLLYDFRLPSSDINTSLIYTKVLIYGLVPALVIAGIVSQILFFTKHPKWYLVAAVTLIINAVVPLIFYPVSLSIFESHNLMLSDEFRERLLYADIGKAILSASFALVMCFYLFRRARHAPRTLNSFSH
jgi:hypothetical protein